MFNLTKSTHLPKNPQKISRNLSYNNINGCLNSTLFQTIALLDISNNELNCFSNDTFSNNPIIQLHLENNRFTQIPTQIGMLQSLNILDLSSNQIQTIPTQIGMLQSLRDLDLSSNQIQTIPTQIGMLTTLYTL